MLQKRDYILLGIGVVALLALSGFLWWTFIFQEEQFNREPTTTQTTTPVPTEPPSTSFSGIEHSTPQPEASVPTPFPLPSESPLKDSKAALQDLHSVPTPDLDHGSSFEDQLQEIEKYNRTIVPKVDTYRQTLPTPSP